MIISLQKISAVFILAVVTMLGAHVAYAQMPSSMPGYNPNTSQYQNYVPEPVPTSCGTEYVPVCAIPPGCDNVCTGAVCTMSCKLKAPKEFINDCEARKNLATILHSGVCTASSASMLTGGGTITTLVAPPPATTTAAGSAAGVPSALPVIPGLIVPVWQTVSGGTGAGAMQATGSNSSGYGVSAANTSSVASTLCEVLRNGAFSSNVSSSVRQLQDFLRDQGYFTYSSTGYFGPLTRAALTQFQLAKGIIATAGDGGVFGPRTRNYVLQNHCQAE